MSWRIERRDPIAVLSYHRPPHNQVSFEALRELQVALDQLADAAEIAVVILAGDTDDHFIGHADLEDLAALARGEQSPRQFALWRSATTALEDLPQPTIAALGGPARGGGSELALSCTFRVGTMAASFTQHEVLRGAMPGAGATLRLPAVIGTSRAARMLMTGETCEAPRALEWGLLDAVLDDPIVDAAIEWAGPIAERPQASLRAIKRSVIAGARLPRADALEFEQRSFLEVFSPDSVSDGRG